MENWRNWQLDKLKRNITTLQYLIQSADSEAYTTYRDGGTGWTALEVLCHLRDYEHLFIKRAHLTIEETDATLPNPDPDHLLQENDYNSQNIQSVFGDLAAARQELLTYLEQRSEEDWAKTAQHPRRGTLSLADQLYLIAWHDANHQEQIAKILLEKQIS
jgi:uncharacterized damage-inducible protein DinB